MAAYMTAKAARAPHPDPLQDLRDGWDQHIAITRQLPNQCRDVDQPCHALIKDLDQRGLLNETLII